MIIIQMLKHMTPGGCWVYASSNPPPYVTPFYKIKYPGLGDTCLSLAGEAVLFFMVFVVIGIAVHFLIGRRHGTRIRVRLVKGAVYGLLAAGLLMPVIIQFDMYFF